MFESDALAIALLNAAADAMFVTDEHGQIVFANDEAERLLRYRRNEGDR